MYRIRSEAAFDSAHFLAGYAGKCSNLHGHRWRIIAEVRSASLHTDDQLRGMVADFGDFKRDLRKIADSFDHAFIYEEGSLKKTTVLALTEEGFRLVPVSFRPTAENLAHCIYDLLRECGYEVERVEIYETPNNCAVYTGEEV